MIVLIETTRCVFAYTLTFKLVLSQKDELVLCWLKRVYLETIWRSSLYWVIKRSEKIFYTLELLRVPYL